MKPAISGLYRQSAWRIRLVHASGEGVMVFEVISTWPGALRIAVRTGYRHGRAGRGERLRCSDSCR